MRASSLMRPLVVIASPSARQSLSASGLTAGRLYFGRFGRGIWNVTSTYSGPSSGSHAPNHVPVHAVRAWDIVSRHGFKRGLLSYMTPVRVTDLLPWGTGVPGIPIGNSVTLSSLRGCRVGIGVGLFRRACLRHGGHGGGCGE